MKVGFTQQLSKTFSYYKNLLFLIANFKRNTTRTNKVVDESRMIFFKGKLINEESLKNVPTTSVSCAYSLGVRVIDNPVQKQLD
jgi:hypothetical protein